MDMMFTQEDWEEIQKLYLNYDYKILTKITNIMSHFAKFNSNLHFDNHFCFALRD